MGEFYDKIWDEERVFLFLYTREYTYEHEYDDKDSSIILPIKVSKIREKIKNFDKYGITNEKFKQNLMDLGYCKKDDAKIDEIWIHQGITSEIHEKINEIYTNLLSDEFFEFLHRQPIFLEKRDIIDYINKIKSNRRYVTDSNKKSNFIEYLVDHFNILADLFLQQTGKMIF